ncbi:MAG: 4-(cytidine 5'-diphospho)-2-C-methyl-D-erythritol kinase [Hyphomicrobium sp.]
MTIDGHDDVLRVGDTTFSTTARAKINLTLNVLGRRADGYHEIASLVAFADFGDCVTLDLSAPPSVSVTGPFAAALSGPNILHAALERLAATALTPALRLGHVTLDKQLPVAAGIGGGSADAAALLRLVRAANPQSAAAVDWMALAASLGADVPVCLANETAWMSGIGDSVTARPDLLPEPLDVVLVNPMCPVPADKTARVFKALAAPPFERTARQAPDSFASRDDLVAFMRKNGNDMEGAAQSVVAESGAVLMALRALSTCHVAALSGAGPTAFAVFASAHDAGVAAEQLARRNPAWFVRQSRIAGPAP